MPVFSSSTFQSAAQSKLPLNSGINSNHLAIEQVVEDFLAKFLQQYDLLHEVEHNCAKIESYWITYVF